MKNQWQEEYFVTYSDSSQNLKINAHARNFAIKCGSSFVPHVLGYYPKSELNWTFFYCTAFEESEIQYKHNSSSIWILWLYRCYEVKSI